MLNDEYIEQYMRLMMEWKLQELATMRSRYKQKYIEKDRVEGHVWFFNDYFSNNAVYTYMNNSDKGLECESLASHCRSPWQSLLEFLDDNVTERMGLFCCRNALLLFTYWHMDNLLIVSMIVFELEKPWHYNALISL